MNDWLYVILGAIFIVIAGVLLWNIFKPEFSHMGSEIMSRCESLFASIHTIIPDGTHPVMFCALVGKSVAGLL